MVALFMGDRAWIGRLAAGLAILGFAGYRLANHQGDTAVIAVVGLVVIAIAIGSARRPPPDQK